MWCLMGKSFPDLSVADFRTYFSGKESEQDLADAYAILHIMFVLADDKEYDYEVGTPEHKKACAITDEWLALEEEYEERIFTILENEGVFIPKEAQNCVLRPFMERNGYACCDGWWIKRKQI